jgi:hypothetical protein
MFPTYDISYEEFRGIIIDFSKELNINYNQISLNHQECKSVPKKDLIIIYEAEYFDETNNHIRLFIEVVKDNKNKSIINSRYSLSLGFSDTPAIFHFYHKMRDTDIPISLDRWLYSCLSEINEQKRTPFDYYFSDSPYLNYGMEGISKTTADLFKITLFGSLNTLDIKKVWIARIRHIQKGDLYRSFSYAILPYGLVDWLIFPDAVGLDSGGALAGYESIENSIKEAQKIGEINIINIDSSLEDFKNKFKYLYMDDLYPPHQFESFYESVKRMKNDDDKLNIFFTEIQRIDENIKKQEYMLVLRDMRALIEGICKHICEIKSIEIKSERPRITYLSSALVDNKIVDHHIRNWFEAFNSIANEAAHEIDSSKVFEMDREIRNDLFETTIKLGEHLIVQLISKI